MEATRQRKTLHAPLNQVQGAAHLGEHGVDLSQMNEHLIELEVKISHQEVAIEELKQTTFEQHKRIEALEKELKHLKNRLDTVDTQNSTVGPGNEKPPHY